MRTDVGRGRVIRQHLLDSLIPLAPLTILCGIPGTAKSTLVSQLYSQMVRDPVKGDSCVLVDFPRRRLSPKSAIAFAVENAVTRMDVASSVQDYVLALRRGRLDVEGLTRSLRQWSGTVDSCRVFVTNYEWQECPEIDDFVVSVITAGIDVVCTLVDPEPLLSKAQAEGIAVKLVDDSQLCFGRDELAQLAELYGVDPTPEILAHVRALTAGHPMMSAVAMMALAQIERIVVEHGEVTLVGQSFPGGSAKLRDLVNRPGGGSGNLRHVDPSELSVEDLGRTVAIMSFQEPAVGEFRSSAQGSSPFVRFTSGLLAVPWADLEALESGCPGSAAYVRRLSRAGYTRIEFDGQARTRLVWNEGVRAAASSWNRGVDHERGAVDEACDLRPRLLAWYAQHGRLDEAVRFVAEAKSPQLVEDLASMSFVDLVIDGRSHGFGALPPKTESEARAHPVTTVLAGLESYPLARDDQRVAHLILTAVDELQSKCASGGEAASLDPCLHALVGLGILDRWEDGERLVERALSALAERTRSAGPVEANAKVYLLLGILSLVRAEIHSARLALSRAVALARRNGRVFLAAAVGLHALEGYFGEFLFDPTVDRNRLLDRYHSPTMQGLAWQESKIFSSLARTWSHLWKGDYETALEVIRSLVREVDRSAVQPMVVWTYGLVLLLNGLPTQAHAFYREVDEKVRRAGLPPRSSSIFVLGAVLSTLSDGRLVEASDLASRRAGAEKDIFDRLTGLIIDAASGREVFGPLTEDPGPAAPPPTARARTLLSTIRVLSLMNSGHVIEARDLVQRVFATASPIDMDFVCRFTSRATNVALADLVADFPPGEVKDAIVKACDGPHVFRDSLAQVRLSEAQLDVLRCLAKGMRNQEIADALYLSVNTVKTHLREINRKLGATDRFEALALARRYGLLAP